MAAWLGASLLAPTPASARTAPVMRFEDFPRGLGESLGAQATVAYDRAAEWFDADLDGPVIVRWVSRAEGLERHGVRTPAAVAGVAVPDSGLVMLYAPALGPRPERIRSVLLHELCHLFFAAATRGAELAPPQWLNEGIAMHVSGEWDLGMDWQSDQASLLRDALAAGAVLPSEELDTGFPEGRFFHVAYAQSLSFIDWLVRQQGDDGLRAFVRELDRDRDPEPAFRHVYGMTLDAAEAAWLDEVSGPGPLGALPSGRTVLEFLWVAVALLVVVRFVRNRRQLRNAPDDGEEPIPSEPAPSDPDDTRPA